MGSNPILSKLKTVKKMGKLEYYKFYRKYQFVLFCGYLSLVYFFGVYLLYGSRFLYPNNTIYHLIYLYFVIWFNSLLIYIAWCFRYKEFNRMKGVFLSRWPIKKYKKD